MVRYHCQHLAADIEHFVKSMAEEMVVLQMMEDKDTITTEELISYFGFTATTAKRYLRQLTDFGYLEAHGGNKNRTYSKRIVS